MTKLWARGLGEVGGAGAGPGQVEPYVPGGLPAAGPGSDDGAGLLVADGRQGGGGVAVPIRLGFEVPFP
ncbi:hypothetical protein GBF35_30095 [Nonomuraea phyllanthi]|uniref:hypothetical protein n=1 Tax=Nonomuraea phyllanthi TaxID=2219224 RepID=UPI001293AE45|nr:hypothetical protein [Nonomuraea phyllanthi]QFY10314.1 hypothetical protein GBF35_30095 [Nonomuraea phyllanthi]